VTGRRWREGRGTFVRCLGGSAAASASVSASASPLKSFLTVEMIEVRSNSELGCGRSDARGAEMTWKQNQIKMFRYLLGSLGCCSPCTVAATRRVNINSSSYKPLDGLSSGSCFPTISPQKRSRVILRPTLGPAHTCDCRLGDRDCKDDRCGPCSRRAGDAPSKHHGCHHPHHFASSYYGPASRALRASIYLPGMDSDMRVGCHYVSLHNYD